MPRRATASLPSRCVGRSCSRLKASTCTAGAALDDAATRRGRPQAPGSFSRHTVPTRWASHPVHPTRTRESCCKKGTHRLVRQAQRGGHLSAALVAHAARVLLPQVRVQHLHLLPGHLLLVGPGPLHRGLRAQGGVEGCWHQQAGEGGWAVLAGRGVVAGTAAPSAALCSIAGAERGGGAARPGAGGVTVRRGELRALGVPLSDRRTLRRPAGHAADHASTLWAQPRCAAPTSGARSKGKQRPSGLVVELTPRRAAWCATTCCMLPQYASRAAGSDARSNVSMRRWSCAAAGAAAPSAESRLAASAAGGGTTPPRRAGGDSGTCSTTFGSTRNSESTVLLTAVRPPDRTGSTAAGLQRAGG